MSDRPDSDKMTRRVSESRADIHPFKLIPDCGPSGGCALWRKVLTMEEAAMICGLNRSTMTRHAMTGALRTHLVGERRLVDERDMARFIDGCYRRPGGDCKGGQPSDPGFSCNGFCAKMEDIERYLCPLLMTVKKASNAIRIHWTTLTKFISTGELTSSKLGSARRISAFELGRFFDNRIDGKNASNGEEA
jgi:hypothetical protein